MKEVLQKRISVQKWQLVWPNQKTVAQPQCQSLSHSQQGNQIPFSFYLGTDLLLQPLNYTSFCDQGSGPLFLAFKKKTALG